MWSFPDIDPPVELAAGLTIGKNPDWYSDEQFKETLTNEQYSEIESAPHALMYRFESISLEEADTQWKGLGQRTLLDKALETIQFANMSLWMSKPTTIYYERVITFDCSNTPEIKSVVVPLGPLYAHSAYASELAYNEDLINGAQLTKAMLTLSPKTALWVAQYSLWTALIQRTWEVRYLTLWTGLEGLFGPDEGQEVTHKISQRIALFLHGHSDLAYEHYKRVKKAYGWRSKTVHGMRLDKLTSDDSEKLLLEAEMYMRDSLMKILQSQELIEHFSNKGRDEYLDRLAFQIG
jgi:hypothetical protein